MKMNAINALHQAASELSIHGEVAMAKGDMATSKTFFQKAYELEKSAAIQMPINEQDSLSKFVLLRSAAALAYKIGKFEEAEQLIIQCLSKNPPDFIVKELNDISELIKKSQVKTTSSDKLNIRGILTQANAELQAITVKDDQTGETYSIFVPSDKLDVIVVSFWHSKVNIEAVLKPQKGIYLETIKKAA